MRKLIYILLILMLASCSPQKRLARLLERHPELQTRDTITITETLPGATFHDTIKLMPEIDGKFIDLLIDSLSLADSKSAQVLIIKHNIHELMNVEPVKFSEEDYNLNIWVDKGVLKYELTDFPKKITIKEPVERIKYVKPDRLDKLIGYIPLALIALIILGVLAILKKFLP